MANFSLKSWSDKVSIIILLCFLYSNIFNLLVNIQIHLFIFGINYHSTCIYVFNILRVFTAFWVLCYPRNRVHVTCSKIHFWYHFIAIIIHSVLGKFIKFRWQGTSPSLQKTDKTSLKIWSYNEIHSLYILNRRWSPIFHISTVSRCIFENINLLNNF